MKTQRPPKELLDKLEELDNVINQARQKALSTKLSFPGRIVMSICNRLVRLLKPVDLEIFFIQCPKDKELKKEHIEEIHQRLTTPIEYREQKEEPPTCCVMHVLEYIGQTKHCHLKDNELQRFFSICIEEEEFEVAEVIKAEASRRKIPVKS